MDLERVLTMLPPAKGIFRYCFLDEGPPIRRSRHIIACLSAETFRLSAVA
jgi:hypothetical protein